MAKQETVYWPEDEQTNIVPVEIVEAVCSNILCRYLLVVLYLTLEMV